MVLDLQLGEGPDPAEHQRDEHHDHRDGIADRPGDEVHGWLFSATAACGLCVTNAHGVAILEEAGALDRDDFARGHALEISMLSPRTPTWVTRRRSTTFSVIDDEHIAVAILHHDAGDWQQQRRTLAGSDLAAREHARRAHRRR